MKEGEGDEQGEKENRPKGPSSILGAFYSKEKEGEYWISMVCTIVYLSSQPCISVH